MDNGSRDMQPVRYFIATLLILVAASGHAGQLITVYKSLDCGCCNDWVDHMQANGFEVTTFNVTDLNQVRKELGVPFELSSCHTAKVGGYVIEGHVPAADVKRLLKERPKISGLIVPRMPVGSPGMEGSRADDYDVLMFHQGKTIGVYASYRN
jgi:hypothetical protein